MARKQVVDGVIEDVHKTQPGSGSADTTPLTAPEYRDLSEQMSDIRNWHEEAEGMAQANEQRIGDQEKRVTDFLGNAHPEKRYVQKIKIGGSSDFLYPVMWKFPTNEFGVGKLEISRAYYWNRGTLHATHVAALLLQLEGNSVPLGGDANYMKVRKFHQRYNATASHLQFAGYANRESADGVNPPDYGGDGVNYIYSGAYLRGGGLDYVLSSNWKFTPVRIDEDDPNAERVLHAYKNSKFVVRPIPFSALKLPVEN